MHARTHARARTRAHVGTHARARAHVAGDGGASCCGPAAHAGGRSPDSKCSQGTLAIHSALPLRRSPVSVCIPVNPAASLVRPRCVSGGRGCSATSAVRLVAPRLAGRRPIAATSCEPLFADGPVQHCLFLEAPVCYLQWGFCSVLFLVGFGLLRLSQESGAGTSRNLFSTLADGRWPVIPLLAPGVPGTFLILADGRRPIISFWESLASPQKSYENHPQILVHRRENAILPLKKVARHMKTYVQESGVGIACWRVGAKGASGAPTGVPPRSFPLRRVG